ncbi:MAG: hypothetical protein LBP76_00155 [Treponema sp.]|jgi:hypothetical protein|nr:hypothetical protein [Treponema sp.]
MEAEIEQPETSEFFQSEVPVLSDAVPEQPETLESSQSEALVFSDAVSEQSETLESFPSEAPAFSDTPEQPETLESSQSEVPVLSDAVPEQPETSESSPSGVPVFLAPALETPESAQTETPELSDAVAEGSESCQGESFLLSEEVPEESLVPPFEYEKCLSVLLREKELLGEIASMQAEVRRAVINREWTDFDSMLDTLNSLGDEFQALEADRVELFKAAFDGNEEGADFYGIVLLLTPEQRSRITEVYRTLKIEFFKVRMANDTLTTYLNEAKTVVTEFLGAAFPERRNHLYSRSGVPIPQDMRSLIVNQSF